MSNIYRKAGRNSEMRDCPQWGQGKGDAVGKRSRGQALQSLVGHVKVSDFIVCAKSLCSFNI